MIEASSDLKQSCHSILQTVLDTADDLTQLDLIDSGRMDSLALVSLILELEASLDVNIDSAQLNPEAFRTVDALVHFISTTVSPPLSAAHLQATQP